MNEYQLIISSPDGEVFNKKVVFLSLRGANGDLAILAGHIPFVTTVKPCEVKIELLDETELYGTINEGLLSVTNENATLLTGSFTWKK